MTEQKPELRKALQERPMNVTVAEERRRGICNPQRLESLTVGIARKPGKISDPMTEAVGLLFGIALRK